MMSINKKLRTLLTLLLLTCSFSFVQAQGGPDDPGGPGGDPGGGDTNVPIDGGLSVLIAAGIGYAAKKGYDKRKKEKALQGTDNNAE